MTCLTTAGERSVFVGCTKTKLQRRLPQPEFAVDVPLTRQSKFAGLVNPLSLELLFFMPTLNVPNSTAIPTASQSSYPTPHGTDHTAKIALRFCALSPFVGRSRVFIQSRPLD